jgi:hypothetical protein
MGEVRVECYSGYKADERPVRFTLRERTFEVAEVEDRWYSPAAIYFRVRAEDGNYYILRHDEAADAWTLAGFRAERAGDLVSDTLDRITSTGPYGAS